MNAESKPLSVLCVLAGIAILVITASMNLDFGRTIAATDNGKLIFATASIACDVIGIALFGILVGRLVKSGNYGAAIIPAVVLTAAVVWSISSMIGFGATERMSVAAARQGAIDRTARADKMQEGYLKWLRGTAISTARTKSQRKEFLEAASAELSKARKEISTEVHILPDAQAELLSRLTNRSVDTVQVGLVAWLACLLILMKASLFSMSGYLWPKAPVEVFTERIVDVEPTVHDLEETDLADTLHDVEDSLAPAGKVSPEPRELIDARHRKQVRAFFSEELRPDPNGSRDATSVYQAYSAWAKTNGHAPMKQARFGRLADAIGIAKKTTGKNIVYRVSPVSEVPDQIAA